jgi:hypothetical protein
MAGAQPGVRSGAGQASAIPIVTLGADIKSP